MTWSLGFCLCKYSPRDLGLAWVMYRVHSVRSPAVSYGWGVGNAANINILLVLNLENSLKAPDVSVLPLFFFFLSYPCDCHCVACGFKFTL